MNRLGTYPIEAAVSPARRPSRSVLLAVPPGGFGAQRAWLDANCGAEGWAWAPAGTGGIANNALALYFVEPQQADVFIRRFCCAYRSCPSPKR